MGSFARLSTLRRRVVGFVRSHPRPSRRRQTAILAELGSFGASTHRPANRLPPETALLNHDSLRGQSPPHQPSTMAIMPASTIHERRVGLLIVTLTARDEGCGLGETFLIPTTELTKNLLPIPRHLALWHKLLKRQVVIFLKNFETRSLGSVRRSGRTGPIRDLPAGGDGLHRPASGDRTLAGRFDRRASAGSLSDGSTR